MHATICAPRSSNLHRAGANEADSALKLTLDRRLRSYLALKPIEMGSVVFDDGPIATGLDRFTQPSFSSINIIIAIFAASPGR
jgi:hypothetical protein